MVIKHSQAKQRFSLNSIDFNIPLYVVHIGTCNYWA